MRYIIILVFFIFALGCDKDHNPQDWDSFVTINGKKHYGSTTVGVFKGWFEISIILDKNEFDDGYNIFVRKAIEDLEVNKKYFLGDDNLFSSLYDTIPTKYNNACMVLSHGRDASSPCHWVCTKCEKKSYFMITEFTSDSSMISGTMDLSVLHQVKIENQTNPTQADYRIKDVYFRVKPKIFR